MGKNWTAGLTRMRAAAACALLAACSGADPDPRAIARRLAPSPVPRADTVAPVTATFAAWDATSGPHPAPVAETQRASLSPPAGLPPPRLAVGPHAQGALQPRAIAALATAAGAALRIERASDRDAVERLLQGDAELALVTGKLSPSDQRAGLQQTLVGVELWALAVPGDAPPRSLSAGQVRKVLNGELRAWTDVGHSGGPIVVLVPSDPITATRAAKALIHGDPFGETCVPVTDSDLAARLREPGTLAVVRAAAPLPPDVRLLSIDWNAPTSDTFAYGTYPYGHAVSLVTFGAPSDAARALLEHARCPAGSQVLGRTLVLPR
jgi:hypothetical protein